MPRWQHPWRMSPTVLAEGKAECCGNQEDRQHLEEVGQGRGVLDMGCAELAPKKPPPLVPTILIASWDATGPIGDGLGLRSGVDFSDGVTLAHPWLELPCGIDFQGCRNGSSLRASSRPCRRREVLDYMPCWENTSASTHRHAAPGHTSSNAPAIEPEIAKRLA